MKHIDLNKLNTDKMIKLSKEALVKIEGGCTFYKDYDSCTQKFLHNRRLSCGVEHLNITGKYTKRYHLKNKICPGSSW